MLVGRNRSIFKVIIFVFAAIFVNLSVDNNHPAHQRNISSDANEIESLVELVLELGFDIDQAVPENGVPDNDDSTTKVSFFDWYYGDDSQELPAVVPVALASSSSFYADKDIGEYIKEIIPPPPKA